MFAIAVAIGLTAGAFTLSFSVLRDLATQGLMPAQWAWIFPAIVDGAILGATIAVVVLSKINGSDEGKKFFLWLLVAVVCISVVGNAFHAYQAAQEAARKIARGIDIGFTPLSPAAAAAIAVIPPLLVLAFSHGIGILIKAIGNAYAEYNELVNAVVASADATTETVAWQDEPIASVGEPILDSSAVGAVRKPDVVNDPSESAAGAYIETPVTLFQVHNVAPVAPAIAPVAPSVARVAPDVHDVAQPAAVAADYATSALDADSAPEEPEQTTEALLEFIEQAPGLSTQVRATARLKILDPDMTFAAIAELTGGVAASTAMRRYNKAEEAAFAAGFTMPPLPDLGQQVFDEDRELVTS
ncbi:DUF2637 domain-containing protein [Rhodococcus zopfii]|uniref:DUF2637 domain-containing protein n=1 Tax=Rhodococcus zopfii TaxID=43772 RepID=UPI001EDFE945|nr:DUF2637 domain-containing protein [Rhodococcus zopfii]